MFGEETINKIFPERMKDYENRINGTEHRITVISKGRVWNY